MSMDMEQYGVERANPFQFKSQGAVLSEINLTPLVDVVFVLLIIFMVTAPLLTEGVDVELPKTREVSELPQDEQTIVVSLKDDGTILIDTYTVTVGELAKRLERITEGSQASLFLRADARVAYGRVVEVMGEIKAAGIDRIGVVANRPEGATEGTAGAGS